MAFCTAADVKLKAGSSLGTLLDADLTLLIAEVDDEITDILTDKGLTASVSDKRLKRASVYKTIAAIKRRQSHELSRPNSLGGDISFSAQPETEAVAFEEAAAEQIALYIRASGGNTLPSSPQEVTRSDAVMDDFKLDQSPQGPPPFGKPGEMF